MKLGHSADEIRYDATEGTLARYVLVLEGEHTMSILCDSADPDRVIKIARDGVVIPTAGKFEMTSDFSEGPDGELLDVTVRVNEKSVYTYILPRLSIMLGRLLRAA